MKVRLRQGFWVQVVYLGADPRKQMRRSEKSDRQQEDVVLGALL